MTTVTEFNLSEAAARVVRTSGSADVSVNVDLLLNEIPYHDYRAVLRVLLHQRVLNAQSMWRRQAKPKRDPKEAAGQWREQAKTWRLYPLHVGSHSVTLGEATVDDLRAAAEIRYAHARGCMAWGDKFAALADALDVSGYLKLGELDDQTVIAIWEAER